MIRILQGRKFQMRDRRLIQELKLKHNKLRTRKTFIEWMIFKKFAVEILPDLTGPIRKGDRVTLKTGGMSYRVEEINGTHVTCVWRIFRTKESKGHPARISTTTHVLPKSKLKKVRY